MTLGVDPSTIPPDYDPMPRRFPSDPRVTRGNPLGSPLLPKGDMAGEGALAVAGGGLVRGSMGRCQMPDARLQ